MAGLVEKTYGDALFELVTEEDPKLLTRVRDELEAVDAIIKQVPELIKLAKTPTVSNEEKLGIIEDAFKGKLCELSYNFLRVVTDAGRLDMYSKICAYFKARCNEHLGIAEITVVTVNGLDAKLRERLKEKMAKILGKNIVIKEETDPSLIGGIIVKHEGTAMDGSVKAKLRSLRNEIGGVIG